MKQDLKILEKPRVLNGSRADILAQTAAIVLLLKHAFKFIVRITNLFKSWIIKIADYLFSIVGGAVIT